MSFQNEGRDACYMQHVYTYIYTHIHVFYVGFCVSFGQYDPMLKI